MTKRALTSLVLCFCAAFTAVAQKSLPVDNRGSLRGLPGVNVLIEPFQDGETESRGLTDRQLQTDVELRLRKAGIRVLTLQETKANSIHPTLYVNLNVIPVEATSGQLYAFCLSVEVQQTVFLVTSPPSYTIANTWNTGTAGTVGIEHLGSLRGKIGDLVDTFINDFLAANPKP